MSTSSPTPATLIPIARDSGHRGNPARTRVCTVRDRAIRLTDAETVAVVPLRGIATLKTAPDGSTHASICSGRGLIFQTRPAERIVPDALTGCEVLVIELGSSDEAYVLQDMPRFTTTFNSLSLLRRQAAWQQAEGEEATAFLVNVLAGIYAAHHQALSRLPGIHQRKVNLYRRLLEVRAVLESVPDATIQHLGKDVHLSRSHFFQQFRSAFGVTPKKHLLYARALRAMNFLMWSTEPISEIALSCGYLDRSAFTRAFTKVIACAPREFRKRVTRQGKPRREVFFELMHHRLCCRKPNLFAPDARTFRPARLKDC